MAWCRQATSHYLSQCWPRSLPPYDVTRPQWVKCLAFTWEWLNGPWASCQIRKIAGAHAPGMPGTFSPSPQVSDPDMHHGTCVTQMPWYMPGLLTSGFLWNRRRGKTFPAFPAHAQPAILRIWQEAHGRRSSNLKFVIFKLVWRIDILSISCEITLRWIRMPQDLPDDKSSHFLNQYWPSYVMPYSFTRPPWVNSLRPSDTIYDMTS